MAERYNYQVTGAAKWAEGQTVTAFCRQILGGNMEVISHDPGEIGAGGQWWSRKGTYELTLTLRCLGIALADQQLWFPTTAGVQMVSFPSFLAEVDDGTSGREFVVTEGQPGTFRASVNEAMDGRIEYEVSMKFAEATPQAVGTAAAAYNSLKCHTINDVTVQATSADIDCLSFELTNDLNPQPNNPMNTKEAGSKTAVDGYYLNQQAPPGFSCVTGGMFKGDESDDPLFKDAWTPEDITIALANGTGAEDITYTLSDYKPTRWNLPVGADMDGFAHEFGHEGETVYNAVTLA